MTGLESWLEEATRQLSKASAAQVRIEIQEHYEASRETAMHGGATPEEADRLAVAALGPARAANCEYRKVLLTAAEARMLRESHREARVVCSRQWLKWTLRAIPVAVLLAAVGFFLAGAVGAARNLLAGAVATGILLAAPFLPIYTPARGRIFRWAKWIVMLALLAWGFGPDWVKWSWLMMVCVWQLAWVEWTRVSIRRKLPVGAWPRHLYL